MYTLFYRAWQKYRFHKHGRRKDGHPITAQSRAWLELRRKLGDPFFRHVLAYTGHSPETRSKRRCGPCQRFLQRLPVSSGNGRVDGLTSTNPPKSAWIPARRERNRGYEKMGPFGESSV